MRQLSIFDEEEMTGIEDDAPDFVREAWRKAKKDMKANFKSLQGAIQSRRLSVCSGNVV